MARICLDYGHGGSVPGAVYKGRKEAEDNLALGKAVAAELRRHGVVVEEIRTADKSVSLVERSSFANRKNCDYFISFHRNAFRPEQAKGVETYVYTFPSMGSLQLAEKIQAALVRVGFTDRGVKRANFHVLRETIGPAVLVEVGFIDNSADNRLFDSKREEIKAAITEAILSQLEIKYLPNVSSPSEQPAQTLYRVMAGSYAIKGNAEKQVERLKKSGFDATIMVFTP